MSEHVHRAEPHPHPSDPIEHGHTHTGPHERIEQNGHGDHHHHGGLSARLRHQIAHAVTPHSHDAGEKVDAAMQTSREGMRTLWLSLAILGATAVAQALIAAWSGSIALLSDTIHNAVDALTALPLGVAFVLGRRAPTRRYTYGYGRAEDLAGIVIVLLIAASSALAAFAAVDRLIHPRPVTHLAAVALAALAGFIGNEWVARYRITTGRRIGSAALVADGLHARTDGFTSLAVLAGAGGAALGRHTADPIIGLVITVAILVTLSDAARQIYRRLMDAVDPDLIDRVEATLRAADGVQAVGAVRMRWIGHTLRAEAEIVVNPQLTVVQAHALAVEAEHALIHAVPRLAAVTVHTDHAASPGAHDPHLVLAHHAIRPDA